MLYFLYFGVILLGLIIGSFINCLVYRLKNKQSLSGRSFCPKCKKQINWYDNIPLVSFVMLKGKCRQCHQHISGHYPLVELVTGIVFLVVFISTYDLQLTTYNLLLILRNFTFAGFLIIIFIYDLKYYLIPDKISVPAMGAALLFNLSLNFSIAHFFNLVTAALIMGGFFLLQLLVSRGKWVGGGDIRLGVLAGLMLGWPLALVALALTYIFGLLISIYLLAAKKKTMQSAVPLGVFFAPAALVVLLRGSELLDWYMHLTL